MTRKKQKKIQAWPSLLTRLLRSCFSTSHLQSSCVLICRLLMAALVFLLAAHAQALERCESDCFISIGERISFTLDHAADVPLAAVEAFPERFSPNAKTHPALGYSDQALWLKLIPQGDEAGKYLVIENANLEHVTLYQRVQEKGWQSLTLGTRHAYRERPVKSRALIYPLDAALVADEPLYLQVVSQTSLSLPVFLASAGQLPQTLATRDALAGVFFGILLALACYHLVIYFVVHERSYFYFALSSVFYVAFLATIEGFIQQWFFPDATSDMLQRIMLCAYCFACFFFYGFLMDVMATSSRLPVTHRILLVLQRGFLLMIPALFVFRYGWMGPFSVVYGALAAGMGVYVTVRLAWAGHVPARWFVAMWALFTLASAMRTLRLLGIGPALFVGEWGLQLASAIGFLFLAFALAHRIRNMREAEHNALRHAMLVEQNANQVLEQKVALRTRELRMEKLYLETLVDARNRFFAHANHEIRTPITAILQYVSFLQRGVGCAVLLPEQKDYLDIVHQHAQRIHTLASHWLDEEKQQARDAQASLVDVNLNTTLEAVLHRLTGLFEPGVKLDCKISPGCERVKANPEYLDCILENLLSNAAKFTSQGSVTLQVVPEPDDPLGEWVRCWVTDTGTGIAEADQHRIFEPYRQGQHNDKGVGTGLGLSTCKMYVGRMGGEMGVKTPAEGGAAFWFTLKRCA